MITAVFDQTAGDVLPETALSHFPFSAEPVDKWHSSSDLGRFAISLYDTPTGMLLASGEYITESTRDAGTASFQRASEQSKQLIDIFSEGLNSLGETEKHTLKAEIGRSLKYYFAYDIAASAILSESAFGSLPHILEGNADLTCSIELAGSRYYKQALQVLRGYLEGQVVDVELTRSDSKFELWRSGNYRIPPLRGESGLLSKLQKANILDNQIVSRIGTAYGLLSRSVHGTEDSFINSGLFEGEHTGLTFRSDKLTQWSQQFCETVELGVILLAVRARIWSNMIKTNLDKCEVCRAAQFENTELLTFGGREHLRRRCLFCTNEVTIRADTRARVYITTLELPGADGQE